jgi:hypothetical protein
MAGNYIGKGPNPFAGAIGQPNGVASLDAGGKVPFAQLPLAGAVFQNALAANVAVNVVNQYFDGPSLALGPGVWLVFGGVTLLDSFANSTWSGKLWDGATVVDSGVLQFVNGGANPNVAKMFLAGVIVNPAGNVKISVSNSISVAGVVRSNYSGAGKDSSLTAIRIG